MVRRRSINGGHFIVLIVKSKFCCETVQMTCKNSIWLPGSHATALKPKLFHFP